MGSLRPGSFIVQGCPLLLVQGRSIEVVGSIRCRFIIPCSGGKVPWRRCPVDTGSERAGRIEEGNKHSILK